MPRLPPLGIIDLADRTASCRDLLGLCTAELERCSDEGRAARLHFECARIHEAGLGDLDGALEHYQQAHRLHGEHLPTVAGLRGALMRREDWPAAAAMLAEEIALTESPEERAALLLERALILEECLGQPAEAGDVYRAALEQVPGDASILRALARTQRREGDQAGLRCILDAQASAATEDRSLLATRLAERGRTSELHPNPEEDACVFYERAVDADPLASAALSHAVRLHAKRHQPARIVALEHRRLEHLSDPGLRLATLTIAGDLLAEHQADRAGAIALFERAAKEAPQDLAVLHRLVELHAQQGDHAAAARALERLEASARNDALRLECRLALAGVHRTRLGDVRAAIHWLLRAQELDPRNPSTAGVLAELYREEQDWQSLAAVLAAKERAAEDLDLRAALHVELAELHEHQLRDVDRAIAHHQAALGLRPGHPGAFRCLSRLLRSERRFVDLVQLHERAVDLAADDTEAISHLLEVALIQETLLDAPGAALGVLERVLALDPQHLLALRGAQRLAESTGNPRHALELMEREIVLTQSKASKVPLLLRAAEICERSLEDEHSSLSFLEQVRSIEPGNRPALAAMERIHRRAGRTREVVRTMQLETESLGDPAARSAHLVAMARIVEENLADRSQALDHYRSALAEDPASEVAARALEGALTRAGLFEELAQHLEARLADTAVPAQRVRVALELARVRELRLGQHREARLAYDTALEEEPDLEVARQGRIRCLGQLAEFGDLVTELLRQGEVTVDPAARLSSLLYAAELLEGELDRPPQAIECYERVIGLAPGHRGALVALERLYERVGAPAESVRVLGLQVSSWSAGSEQVASLRELARAAGRIPELAKLKRDAFARILQREPNDVQALVELEQTFLADGQAQWLAQVDAHWVRRSAAGQRRAAHRTRLAEFLEATSPAQALEQHRPALLEDPGNLAAARGLSRVAEVIGDVALLLEAAEAEVLVVRSPERASRLLRRAARLEWDAGRRAEAAQMLLRALEVYPDDAEAARIVQDALSELGQQERLIVALTAAAGAATRPEVRVGHWISAARLLASVRSDLGAASALLQRVAREEPGHAAVLLELAELYIQGRQWAQAAECLEDALRAEPDPSSTTQARLRLAELYHERLQRAEEARAILRQVIVEAPAETRAQRRLLAIEIETGNPSAESTAAAWAESTTGKEQGEALTTLGRLQRDAGKVDDARRSLARAVAISGVAGGAQQDLVHLLRKETKAGATPPWGVYAEALLAFVGGQAATDEKVAALLEVSAVMIDRLRDHEQGYSALEAGLRLKPNDVVLQKELCRRLTASGRHRRALPELCKLLELAPARTKTWADLTAAFEALGRGAEAQLALGPLVVLGGGTDLQKATWASRKPRYEQVKESSVDAMVLQGASEVSPPESLCALLAQLSTLAPKVVKSGPGCYGLSSRDRVGPRGLHPSRVLLDRMSRAFGVPEVDLYPAESEVGVSVVLTEPVGIVVPPSFEELTDSQQVFCLARPLASIARRTQLVTAVGPQTAQLLLAGAAQVVGGDAVSSSFSSEQVAEVARSLVKAVPWLSKGRFEELARRYVAEEPRELMALLQEVERASLRIALVLSDDLSCLGLVKQRGESLLGLGPADVSPAIHDLLRFWISPNAMTIRRQVGLE